MRQHNVALLALFLLACGDNPTDPPASVTDQLRVLNGPATCNACAEVEMTVAGPGLDNVIDASLKNHATRMDVESSAEIRNFVGDSGLVLLITIGFAGSAPKGDYDLFLRTVGSGGAEGSLVIPIAVKIIAPPRGPAIPPPPPGPIGTVRVATTTSGPTPTVPYLVTVDPCDPAYVCPGRDVGASGSVSIELNPGSYTIALANVPSNCTLSSPTSIAVTIVANQTTDASFSVTCVVVPSGSIRITAPTTGATPALPYEASVNPCDQTHPCAASVPAGGTGSIIQRPGSYTVSLGNVPPTCSVAEPRSVPVTVTANQTVDVSFTVTCQPVGTLRVTAAVTGPEPDDSYIVVEGLCDYYYVCNSRTLVAGGSAEFSLAAGSYAITLTGVAQNCVVDGPNPRTVTVAPGAQTAIHFAVTCAAITRIRVSAPTTGPDADGGYLVAVDNCGTGPCAQLWLDAGRTVEFVVAAGSHTVQLTDVAPNCTVSGTNPVVVTIAGGSTANVSFAVTCTALPPPAVVRVTAPTTGTNRDASYTVVNESSCDFYYGCWQQVLSATGTVQFEVTGGFSYSFRLIDIASNCTVAGPNPAVVNAVAGTTVELAFAVACQ